MESIETYDLENRLGNGLFKTKDANEIGISNAMLAYYESRGSIERVHHGVYVIAGFEQSYEDGFYEFRYADAATKGQGVIGLISALNFHDLTDEIAHYVFVLIKGSTRFRGGSKYFIVRCHDDKQFIGIEEKEGFKITNLERTIIDCFRYKRIITPEIAYQALKEAIEDKRVDMVKLLEYASIFRIKTKVENALRDILCEQYKGKNSQ